MLNLEQILLLWGNKRPSSTCKSMFAKNAPGIQNMTVPPNVEKKKSHPEPLHA
jgi:hypothetical protein